MLIEYVQQLLDVQRFCQIVRRTSVPQAPYLAGCGIGANHDGWDAASSGVCLEFTEYDIPSHIRQVEVQQDQVGTILDRKVQPKPPLHRGQQLNLRAI